MGMPELPAAAVGPGLESYQRMAVFAFGVVFIAVMLFLAVKIPNPSDFQIFVFRTVLGLAAAGIASLIPGFLQIQIAGYLYAGGAIAVFYLVYSVNPPALVNPSFDPEYQKELRNGDNAITSQNYSAAVGFYSAALTIRPRGEEALYGMGKANYHLERYDTARSHFLSAFEATGKTNGNIAAAIALANESLADLNAADRYYEVAAKLLGESSDFGKETIYDRGLLALIRWLRNGSPAETDDSRKAEKWMTRFLESGGAPQRWATYHLACLRATRATDGTLESSERAALQKAALILFDRTTSELLNSRSNKAQTQRAMLRRLLVDPQQKVRRAGDPIGCPSLVLLWSTARERSLLDQLS
jgi:tetratricopeptide (TPR) repeat protein